MTAIQITHPHAQPPVDPGFVEVDSLHGERKPGPTGGDMHPIIAQFNVQAFSHELVPGRAVEAIVGEAVEFVHTRGIPGALWELARRPESSKAKLDGRRLVCDAPGLFVVAVTLPGGYRRAIHVASFAGSDLDLMIYPPAMARERRMRLRAIVSDANATPESIVAGLERGDTDLATLAGYSGKKRAGFSVQVYR
jgi:hypothetical protein